MHKNPQDSKAHQELSRASNEFKKLQEEYKIDTSKNEISTLLEKNPKALARLLDEHGRNTSKESSIDYHSVLMNMPVEKWKSVTTVANEMQQRNERNGFIQSVKDVFNKVDNTFKNLSGKGIRSTDIEKLSNEMNKVSSNSPIKAESKSKNNVSMHPIKKLTNRFVSKSGRSL